MGAFGVAASNFMGNPVEGLAAATVRRGFTVLEGANLRPLLSADELDAFSRFWNDLPLDEALIDGGKYRYRRYGRLRVEIGGDGPEFEVLPHKTFRQDGIPLWKGADREFAPIEEKALLHPGMTALVGFDTELATTISGQRSWELGIHQIRMVARRDEVGLPTPEGRHRDGHCYIGMHLIRREDCIGGESTVYPENGEAARLTLTDPLDSIFVDDRLVTHEVSPTQAVSETGIRDMLLVDINPLGGGE
ncbi:2OG-Fe dioxygenase family protein [Streptomyces sp. NBC_01142]|uniref:2OG-Fe dioxygenase family protein n=1 Tax=Streptomyces sp. NBC_01142 TaxID=2975865 RepID=UPI00225B1832|nr:2OG-Fe dioxygenase family protein [Streptomyces sp. NBC_01142]MCX4820762.1 2OG-Fe dioxygenase family protein [Streptomyces sp. NBC_01142]